MPSYSGFEEAIGLPRSSPRAKKKSRMAPHAAARPVIKLQRVLGRQALPLLIAPMLIGGAVAAYAYAAHDWSPLVIGGGLAIGLLVGVMSAIAREAWRDAIDFKSLAKRMPDGVLGAAPELTLSALRQLAPDFRSPLGALAFQPASRFASAYRELQDALPNQTAVSFIAALPGDGATTTALCAAVSATQQGRRVVVVDCDTRQRAMTKALGFAPDEGVMEACENVADWKSYIAEEPETGLHCIPAARARSPWRSLINVAGLPVLIEQLRREYDLVILDCPPALATAEGALLARMVDRSVVVARWDETPMSSLIQTLKSLRGGSARARQLGVYVNRAPAARD